jgi:uncharacterized DUF497 family protein
MINMVINEFEWDEANLPKIQKRFKVSEVEKFFDQSLLMIEDKEHSMTENCFIVIGYGPLNKPMFVCFTFRQNKIRVISARYIRAKEVAAYEKQKKEY